MKVDLLKTIDKNDYPEESRELMDRLAGVLNNNFINLYNALNGGLNLTDNFNAEVKDITVKVNSSGVPMVGLQFKTKATGILRGLNVIKAVCTDNNNTYPLSHPFISFTQSNDLVTIKHITGLQPNTIYQLTIEIKGY